MALIIVDSLSSERLVRGNLLRHSQGQPSKRRIVPEKSRPACRAEESMQSIFVILASVLGSFAGGLLVSFGLYGEADAASLETTLLGMVAGAAIAAWLAAKFGPEE